MRKREEETKVLSFARKPEEDSPRAILKSQIVDAVKRGDQQKAFILKNQLNQIR